MPMLLSKAMKRRSTTPVSKGLVAKAIIVTTAVMLVAAAPLSMMPRVSADRFDDQINAIQQQIDQYQAQAGQLRAQADTLQTKVDSLNNEKMQIQARIDLNQAQYDQLQNQIVKTKEDIKNNQDALGDILADLYIDDSISPLEMLASSKNIGDYVDKQEYRSSVRDQLSTTITKVKKLKKDLEDQQNKLSVVLANQKASRDELAAKQAEQERLVAETRGQESAYQALASQSRAQQAQVRQQQQEAIAAAIGRSGGATLIAGGADSAYPWNQSNCPMSGYYSLGGSDGNGGDGHSYGCRQCASYAAWRVARETGVYPEGWGNATNFPASARAVHSPLFTTGYTPRERSLAVMHAGTGPEGHVAYVEAVVDGGASLIVSQYNYNYGAGYGMYSKMKLSASIFQEYVYINN